MPNSCKVLNWVEKERRMKGAVESEETFWRTCLYQDAPQDISNNSIDSKAGFSSHREEILIPDRLLVDIFRSSPRSLGPEKCEDAGVGFPKGHEVIIPQQDIINRYPLVPWYHWIDSEQVSQLPRPKIDSSYQRPPPCSLPTVTLTNTPEVGYQSSILLLIDAKICPFLTETEKPPFIGVLS
jgi:hypothetical protein